MEKAHICFLAEKNTDTIFTELFSEVLLNDGRAKSLLLFSRLKFCLDFCQSVPEFAELCLTFGQLFLKFLLLCPGLLTGFGQSLFILYNITTEKGN